MISYDAIRQKNTHSVEVRPTLNIDVSIQTYLLTRLVPNMLERIIVRASYARSKDVARAIRALWIAHYAVDCDAVVAIWAVRWYSCRVYRMPQDFRESGPVLVIDEWDLVGQIRTWPIVHVFLSRNQTVDTA